MLAAFLDLPVEGLTWIFRGLAVGLPVATWIVVYVLCRSRQAKPGPGEVPAGGVALVRSSAGGFEEADE